MGRASLHRDLVNINLVKGTRISLPQVEHAAEDSEQGDPEVGGLAAEHLPLGASLGHRLPLLPRGSGGGLVPAGGRMMYSIKPREVLLAVEGAGRAAGAGPNADWARRRHMVLKLIQVRLQ